ncbi:MAG: hypothetical protein WD054_00485, partial [Gemmatimonadota bacterium]
MTLRMLVHVVVLLAAAAVSPARSAALQAPLTVEGRVIGPDGAPQADQVMMLHRVDRSGGATIAETSSGADGSYVLTAPASTDTSAVYFVAARYDGDLYIGAPFRQGQPDRLAQLIQVGVAGRRYSLDDLGLDAIGAALGVVAARRSVPWMRITTYVITI